MDAVSRLLRLAHIEGIPDLRCLTAGQFTMNRVAPGPGKVPFHLVVEGRCTVSTRLSAVELGPGDLLVLPHGDAHRVCVTAGPPRPFTEEPGPVFTTRRSLGAEPELDLYSGHYQTDSAMGTLLFRTLPPLVHVTLGVYGAGLADVLRGGARFDRLGARSLLGSLFGALLDIALRSRPEQRLDTPALWTAVGDDTLGKVIAGIVERPGEPWTIERMAAAASMSRATFLRRFTARTGTTVASLLTTIRMMVAADLLTRSDHSVSHIARQVGYNSESAFAQAFRAAVGTQPNRFRKEVGTRR
ncbi:cupin domain-containing protein [Amycolatopsis sp. NPDC004368]